MGGAGLLVNTTPLGMSGQPPLEINLRCPPSLVVTDIVYDPLVTPLLAAAREKGLRTADGLGMLLHQAVRGFELWFGVKPEVTPELRALIEADLTKHLPAPAAPPAPPAGRAADREGAQAQEEEAAGEIALGASAPLSRAGIRSAARGSLAKRPRA